MTNAQSNQPTVCIVGGGLAGMAAATALCTHAVRIELFEARGQIGGRATSLPSADGERRIDLCQHVVLGCCTQLIEWLTRMNLSAFFQADDTLNFIDQHGRCQALRTAGRLPAPFHAAPLLFGRSDLSLRQKLYIARALVRLRRMHDVPREGSETAGKWLRSVGQTPATIARFWSVILTSALGETVERASLAAARHVLVEGFMRGRDGAKLLLPTAPLYHIFHASTLDFYRQHDVAIYTGRSVRKVVVAPRQHPRVEFPDGTYRAFDYVIMAVPWNVIESLLEVPRADSDPYLNNIAGIETVPITAIHLWFDRPITPLRHAVLVQRTSQWLFNGGLRAGLRTDKPAHYYQIVISASRDLVGRPPGGLVESVLAELAEIWPVVGTRELLESQVVTYRPAVFSVSPESEAARPSQVTPFPGLFLAGDWTRTGWPATMESAVRSGNLAAKSVLRQIARNTPV